MPLHVYIDLNGQNIEKLHIARLEGDTDPDSNNLYVAVLGDRPLYIDEWLDNGAEYRHRYGDGALVCVRKALEALEIKDAPIQLKSDFSRNGHICGYDFEIWMPTAKCKCGAIATNPFYVGSKND